MRWSEPRHHYSLLDLLGFWGILTKSLSIVSPAVMNKLSGTLYKNDIRAPGSFQPQQIFNSLAYRVIALLLSDLLALALAWRFAEHWNKFYSPVPPQLAW